MAEPLTTTIQKREACITISWRDGLAHRAFSFANRRRSAPFRSVRAILSREHAISTRLLWHLRLDTILLSARLKANNREERFKYQVKTPVAIIPADNHGK